MDNGDDPTLSAPTITRQSAALVEMVVERVHADPHSFAIHRQYPVVTPHPLPPDTIASLALPSGKSLPPSLRRWLAFDAGWLAELGWLSSLDRPQLTPRRLEQVVAEGLEYPGWAEHYAALGRRFPECFLLPPFGEETCRLLVMSEPDAWGEHPVLVADVDDVPTLDLVYPGLDVYLAAMAGLPIPQRRDADVTWTTIFALPPYQERLATHARHMFAGYREVLVTSHREEGYEPSPGDDGQSDNDSGDSHSPVDTGEDIPF